MSSGVNVRDRWIYWMPLMGVLFFLFFAFGPLEGYVGHDYRHQLSRFWIGAAHFWRNGFSVPHYTAHLCGGIPSFADPQSMYYSLAQWLTFLMEPLSAVRISNLIFYFLGYVALLRLLHLRLGVDVRVAHIGSIAFVLNGFSFGHLMVGHVSHQGFLLLPVALYFLVSRSDSRAHFFFQLCSFCLVAIYLFYSGALHMCLLMTLLVLVVLPVLVFGDWPLRRGRPLFVFLLLACLVVFAGVSGKWMASWLYSNQFHFGGIDGSPDGLLSTVFRFFWFLPKSTQTHRSFGQWTFGIWEYVGFVSKITLPALCYLIFQIFKGGRSVRAFSLGGSALVFALICVIAMGNDWNSRLPFFRHYHNPIKLLAVGILPIIVLSTVSLDRWVRRFRAKVPVGVVFVGLFALLFGEFGYYAQTYVVDRVGVSYRYPAGVDARVRRKRALAPVAQIVEQSRADIPGLIRGTSSTRCYEPLFGYRGERLGTKIEGGKTDRVTEGYFNLTHPGCLVYHKYFGCQPWDRIPATQRAALDLFSKGGDPFGVPQWQSKLIHANVWILCVLLAGAIVSLVTGRRRD